MRLPVNSPYQITTPYGWVKDYPLHRDPNDPIIPASERAKYPGAGYGFHTGIDYVPADGKTIATHSGSLSTGNDAINGNYSIVNDSKFRTYIAHQSIFSVRSGTVEEGQQLGVMGETGAAKGAHVHHSLRVDGALVNPALYVNNESEEIMPTEQDVKYVFQVVTGSAPTAQNIAFYTARPWSRLNSWAMTKLAQNYEAQLAAGTTKDSVIKYLSEHLT